MDREAREFERNKMNLTLHVEDPLTLLFSFRREGKVNIFLLILKLGFYKSSFFSTEPTWMTLKTSCHFLVLAFCIPWVVQTSLQPSCTSDSLSEHESTTRLHIWHPFPSQIALWLFSLAMELHFQWLTDCWRVNCTCKENHTTHYPMIF